MAEFSVLKGKDFLDQYKDNEGQRIEKAYANLDSDISDYILGFIFGELYSREGLETKTKQTVTLTTLACKGFAKPQLAYHIGLALDMGITKKEIIDIFLHIAAYDGFPTAINAINTAKDVFAEREI